METCYKCGSLMAYYECDQCHRIFCKDCWGFKTDMTCPDCQIKNELKLRYSITNKDYYELHDMRKNLMELIDVVKRIKGENSNDAMESAIERISDMVVIMDKLLYRFRG